MAYSTKQKDIEPEGLNPKILHKRITTNISNESEYSKAGKQLIFADGYCPQINELLEGAKLPINVLDKWVNPFSEIAQELERRRAEGRPAESIHIVAHGKPGGIYIAGKWNESEVLINNTEHLAK